MYTLCFLFAVHIIGASQYIDNTATSEDYAEFGVRVRKIQNTAQEQYGRVCNKLVLCVSRESFMI